LAASSKTIKTEALVLAPMPEPHDTFGRTLVGWLMPAYVAIIFIGYLMLRAPRAMAAGEELGSVRALFSSVNAATLTGFLQPGDIDKYLPLGQAVIFSLIVIGTLLSFIIGGMAGKRILRQRYSDLRVILSAVFLEIVAIGLGTALLLFDKDRTVWQAVFVSASAIGNSGLTIGHIPAVTSWETPAVLLPLIALGGFGLPVLMELFDLLFGGRPLSPYSKTVLGLSAWLFIGATVLIFGLRFWAGNYPTDAPGRGQQLRELMAASAASAINDRTAGMPLEDMTRLSRVVVWTMMGLMTIGAASAGSAGGIKITTLWEIFGGVRKSMSNDSPGRIFGIAAVWLGAYCLTAAVAVLLLLQKESETPPDQVLFNVISALSNVGLSHDRLTLDPFSGYVLSVTMLIGRLGPLTMLWWIVDSDPDASSLVG
jgi:trk system potassium uptake protein